MLTLFITTDWHIVGPGPPPRAGTIFSEAQATSSIISTATRGGDPESARKQMEEAMMKVLEKKQGFTPEE